MAAFSLASRAEALFGFLPVEHQSGSRGVRVAVGIGEAAVRRLDPGARRIAAQPFLLTTRVEGQVRRHVPDFLLLTECGPLVVDVKPRRCVERLEVAFTFAWTRSVVEGRGWGYEVFSEPPIAVLENLRLLAGYRQDWLFDATVREQVRATGLDSVTVGQACGSVSSRPEPQVRAAVLHLLWIGWFTTDLSTPLSPSHRLARAP